MLTVLLSLALFVVLVVMAVRRRGLGWLGSLASLLAAALMLIWLQDMGLLPGTTGPLTPANPQGSGGR